MSNIYCSTFPCNSSLDLISYAEENNNKILGASDKRAIYSKILYTFVFFDECF